MFFMIQISADFYDMRMCLPFPRMLGDEADICVYSLLLIISLFSYRKRATLARITPVT